VLKQILFNPVVLGVILSPLVFIIVQFAKAGFKSFDKAPVIVKQLVAFVLGTAAAGLSTLIPGVSDALAPCAAAGPDLPDACRIALTNGKTITAILAGILPQLFHIASKISR
jgi:hypothetical protein